MNSEGMDKLDREILAALKEDARMSYSDIGTRVGITRVAVKKRMDVMEKAGIIQGYKVIVDETNVPEGVSYTLDIEAFPEEYQNVVHILAKDRYIRKIYSTTGDSRIHCVGFAPNNKTLDAHVNNLFRNTKGIRRISWHMLLRTIKDIDGGVEYDGYKESEHLETRRENYS